MKKLLRGYWGPKDKALLRRLFPGLPTVEVAKQLGRPVEAVKKMASRMGLKKNRKRRRELGLK